METSTLNIEVEMNIKKSLKLALAERERSPGWLAKKLKVTPQAVSKFAATGHSNTRTIEAFCKVLDMKVSEFIALGES